MYIYSGLRTTVIILLSMAFIAAARAEPVDDPIRHQLKQLKIITEEYPPISFTNRSGKPDGLAVDVVNEIMRRLDMHQEIEIWPWARGYSRTIDGPNFVLFSASRTPGREVLFHWVGSMFEMRSSFYAKKGSEITINSLDDARKLKAIGTYRQSFDEQFLIEEGFTNLDSTTSNQLNIRKLMLERFDVITATNLTISDLLKEAGYKRDDVIEVFPFIRVDNYIVFSKQVSPEVVDLWKEAFDDIREEGVLYNIQRKWLSLN